MSIPKTHYIFFGNLDPIFKQIVYLSIIYYLCIDKEEI